MIRESEETLYNKGYKGVLLSMAAVLPEIITIREENPNNNNIKNLTFINLFDSIGEFLYESIGMAFDEL